MDVLLKGLLASWPIWALLAALLIMTAVLKRLGLIEVRAGRRGRRVAAAAQEGAADSIDEPDEGPSGGAITYPYRARRSLMTAAEQEFHRVLLRAVDGRSAVFAQVNLASLIDAEARDNREQQAAYNRICRKHVDFVLCDMGAGSRPILVIELDDSSHDKAVRRLRDQFLDKALAAASLPILHVPVAASYDPAKLENAIRAALNPSPRPASASAPNHKEDMAKLRASRPK